MAKYKEKTAEFFTFEKEGDVIEGILVGVDEVDFGDNLAKRYIVQVGEGMKSFLGGSQLDALLGDVPMQSGIKVQYQGKTTTRQGRNVNQFRVWIAEEE